MKRLRGPQLKMPDVSVPPFLADLFYDLRDRRLLPLVALVVVAIAAVPFLLGSSEKPVPPPASAGAATAGEREAVDASTLTVVQAKPGLRDYRKRLAGRRPTDPFKQRYTAPVLKGAKLNPQTETSSSSSTTFTTTSSSDTKTTTSDTTTTTTTSGGAPPSGGGKPHLVLFDYAIDARISRSGGSGSQAQQQEPVVKQRVLPQTPLPGEKAPVVTYLGPGRKEGDKATGKVLLLVSGDVGSIAGEYRCVSDGGDVCQMLEVEPGFPLTFAYGDNGVHYTIKVLRIELVVTGHT